MAAPTVSQPDPGAAPDRPTPGFHLVVVGPGFTSTQELPFPAGSLLCGRDEAADVRIVDPAASRQHARVHVTTTDGATEIAIEDLGSANGTRLREQPLTPAERVVVAPGEVITIGSTILFVRRREPSARPGRVVAHGHFEAQLIEICAGAEAAHGTFGLLRLALPGPGPTDVEAIFARELRPGDLVGAYGPGEYEILLPDSHRAACDAVAARLVDGFARAGQVVRTGLGFFPADGASPGALFGRASDLVRGADGARAQAVVVNPAMRALYALCDRVAASALNVLIVGETGTGKEVLAQALHERTLQGLRGARDAEARFVGINCAALTESLLESELYGHEKGAFTGAGAAKPGLLEVAGAGTVFLDEIGEMAPGLQAKLLRALETRTIVRVGGTQPRRIDARFVAATNRDLDEEIAQKRFRQDLYFRLNGITLALPPLRERSDEIGPLARSFVEGAARAQGRPAPAVGAAALALLEGFWWPGNIRELRNVMERALLFCTGSVITPEHLPEDKMRRRPPDAPIADAATLPDVRQRQAEIERHAIVDALARCGGNQSRAAELLGMPRRTLVNRLKEYGITRPRS